MDVLAWNVIAWISAFKNNRRVGLYCSDVSGAFDRVKKERLIEKMRAKGLHPSILKIVSSWLEEREFTVIVDGVQSEWHKLENSIYQGTVWGPPLWNCFYEDSRRAIRDADFIEVVFVDDLNCYKECEKMVEDGVIMDELKKCQK